MIYRVYFNCKEDFPRIWSFDEGDISTEKLVTNFRGIVPIKSGYDPNGNNKTTPTAYFTVEADNAIVDEQGVVTFF